MVKVKQSHYRPGQAQRVLRKLRFPDFVTTAQDGGRYAPAAFTPRKCSWYSFLLEAESTPGPQCDRKYFMSMKNPLTPAGIEPATFRFVTQHLNHCATGVPRFWYDVSEYRVSCVPGTGARAFFSPHWSTNSKKRAVLHARLTCSNPLPVDRCISLSWTACS